MKKINKSAFTLLELMIAVLILSIVLVAGFSIMGSVSVGKIKIIEETTLEKEALYFSEKMFDMIKLGGMIDYEEYFNRTTINSGATDIYSSGHYSIPTGFGNFGHGGAKYSTTYPSDGGFYYCVSKVGDPMGIGGCVKDFNTDNKGTLNTNYTLADWHPQRYGQYGYQFIDYNSNADDDSGDEDGDGNIRGDADDEFLGDGPIAFSGSQNVVELYLISGDGTKRTFFRWNVKQDPRAPAGATCTGFDGDPSAITGSGCLGTIEFLELDGKDWGLDHNDGSSDSTEYDGVIDTWVYADGFVSTDDTVAGSTGTIDTGWVSIFPNDINVKDVKFFLYPNKDYSLAWMSSSLENNINPYLRLQMTISPSRKKRSMIKGKIPEVKISTTINLTGDLSR